MNTFPGSPRLLKGALVAFERSNPQPRVIRFQYNPQTLTRTVEAQFTEGEDATSEAMRLHGAPIETIQLNKVEWDATDQLELADSTAVRLGLYPQLSDLELLLYPSTTSVIENTVNLFTRGTLEIIPPEAPFILFIWGLRRILPVRLTTLNITETLFDVNLNPIHAEISFTLRVLSYSDWLASEPGYYIFLSHQVVKEALAEIGRTNSLTAISQEVASATSAVVAQGQTLVTAAAGRIGLP